MTSTFDFTRAAKSTQRLPAEACVSRECVPASCSGFRKSEFEKHTHTLTEACTDLCQKSKYNE